MSQPFNSDAQKGQKHVFFFLFVKLFISTRFFRTSADRDIINTLLEPLRPADVPFGGYKTEAKDLGGIFGGKIDFFGCSRAI